VETDVLKRKWAEGATTLGAWISMREPLVAEVAGNAGFDYVCVDMQHGLSDLHDTVAALQALAGGAAAPLVRVPWNEPGIIGRALDLGALGVVIPMVNNRADAEAAVAACRYAPLGGRSFGPTVALQRFGPTYYDRANRDIACIPMIETVEALGNLDEILSVPGVDAAYIGPADLSISLGLPPRQDQDDERFQQALAAVVAACNRHGVVPGVHANAGIATTREQQGFRMITVTADLVAAVSALRADLAATRPAAARPALTAAGPY
jgi:4-hydroxy-2-oxoheptanedioate aldolase